MKTYKGTLNYYYATGENPHFYVWTGNPKAEQHDWENHVLIEDLDIVHIKDPNDKKSMVIYQFTNDLKELEYRLGKRKSKVLLQAVKENWEVEICKLEIQ